MRKAEKFAAVAVLGVAACLGVCLYIAQAMAEQFMGKAGW